MSKLALIHKTLDYVKRRAFRRKLYSKSQAVEVSNKSAVIFSPHQDDETLGCGGIIALKRSQGVPVKVVFLTDGRECYWGAPSPIPISAEACIQIRQQEALAALQILGVGPSDVIFLDHRDSTLESLAGEQREQVIQELQDLLSQLHPQEVYVPYFKDMHGDHIETFSLVKEAAKRVDLKLDFWQYLVWSLWRYDYLNDLVESNFANLYSVSIDSVQQRKNEALLAYRSQYEPIIEGFSALPKTFLKFFDSPRELFVRAGEI